MDWYRLLPRYWMQNEPTDYEWDEALNKALDLHVVEVLSKYEVQIGPFKVWIENWPYAYGSRRLAHGFGIKSLPKVATRKRLKKAVKLPALPSPMAELDAYKP